MLEPLELILAGIAGGLLLILMVSFRSRARVFCQYLRYMTGIQLTPGDVNKVFHLRGKAGVRDLFLDLLIREDLDSSPPVTPESPPLKPAVELINR